MTRTILLVSLLATGGFLMAAAGCGQGSDSPPPVPAIEQVRDNLYVIEGGDPTDRDTFSGGNVAVYVMEQGVAVVDSKLPGYGQQIIEQIRTVTDKPIVAMFHTHTHNDHAGSTPEFPETIEVITHENIKASLTRETCLPVTNCQTFQGEGAKYLPQTTFSNNMSVWFGQDQIDLYHFGAGHTSGDSIVVFRALGVAHTGDLFAWKGVPYIDVGNGGSGVSYPKTLLAAADGISGVDTVIPGHSPVMTWADFREFGEFNRDFLTAVERGKAEGKSSAETAASLNLPARYANYAMSRGTLTSAEQNTEKIYAELSR